MPIIARRLPTDKSPFIGNFISCVIFAGIERGTCGCDSRMIILIALDRVSPAIARRRVGVCARASNAYARREVTCTHRAGKKETGLEGKGDLE